MTIHDQLGTYATVFHDELPNGHREIGSYLRTLVQELHAETHEVARTGDKAVSYGWGPKKMLEAYCYVMPLKKHVNLGFYHGVALPDPAGLLEGTGKRLRHVKLRSREDAQRPEVRDLLAAAMAERKEVLK